MKTIATVITSVALLGFTGLDSAAGAEETYKAKCQACHANAIAGAPKFGDKASWAPRIATGMDAMMATVINGKGAMPPMGTCMDCSEDDLKAVVQYMVDAAK